MFSKKDFWVHLRVIAVAVFLLMGAWQSTSFAAWTQINIPGTTGINYVAVADSVLFAAANLDSMVFRSTDHGATWQKVTGIRWFSQVKGNNSKLFAIESFLGSYGPLFSSTDHGNSWNKVTIFDSIFNPGSMDLSVQDNKILFQDTRRPFLSMDNGQSWAILNSFGSYASFGLGPVYIQGNKLFASARDGLFSSNDLGHNWQAANYGIYSHSNISRIGSVDKYLYIYARTILSSIFDEVYCSVDSGYSWKSMKFTGYALGNISISLSKTTVFIGADNSVYAAPLDSTHWTDISMSPKVQISSLATDAGYIYATKQLYPDTSAINYFFRRPLSEVNAQLKKQVTGPQPHISNNFSVDNFTSQHALGITFSPGRAEKASLRVYSATGKAVATLFDGLTQYGTNKFIWDYKTMPSGIYCISLQSENGKAVKKVQVMR
jgi:photosystem II stability/assembly factor-like uncharacterized protein